MEHEEANLQVEQTDESLQAEEAAFAAAFNATRGVEEPTPEPAVEEAAVEQVTTDEQGATEEAAEQVAAEEAAPAKLIAGLTEDQVAAALTRAGALQSTVDKMAGRLGSLMQQIEALKSNPPTTQAAQQSLDLKLERLSAQFPELANLLREDLSTLQQAQASSPAPAGLTKEQFDAAMTERLAGTTASLTEQMEMKILSIQHPDWLDVIKTPQFSLFRDNVLPPGVGQQLMASEDSAFISSKLTEFKQWRDKQSAPAQPAPTSAARKNRLSAAVVPSGAGPAPRAPQTEEDAFLAGFKAVRAGAGY